MRGMCSSFSNAKLISIVLRASRPPPEFSLILTEHCCTPLAAPEMICAEERKDVGTVGQDSAQQHADAAGTQPIRQFNEKLLKYRTNCALHSLNLLRSVGTKGLDSMQSLSLEDDDAPPPPPSSETEGEGSLATEKMVVGKENNESTKKSFPREWRVS